MPAQTDSHKYRVSSIAHSDVYVRVVQWSNPRSAPHSSLCPALIHLPTRYYRDTAEKNAESRLGDRNARRPGLNLNNKEKTHNTTLRGCYIMLLQDSAMKSTCKDLEKRKTIT